MDAEASVGLRLSPEGAWALLSDLGRLHEWAPDVTASPSDPLRVGAVRRARLAKPAFGKADLVERVVDVGPRSFTYDIEGGIGPLRAIRTTWSVHPDGAGCRVAVASRVTLAAPLSWLPFLARRAWRRQLQQLADAFAAWARTQTVEPPFAQA